MVSPAAQRAPVPPERQLVEAARAGDREAFGELVGRYQTLMASFALSLTRDLVLSEEIAQDTFLRAWRRLPKLRDPAGFRAYLYKIARGLCADRRRDRRKHADLASRAGAGYETAAADPSPLDRVISHEEQRVVSQALDLIPERYRLPLILYYREQQSVDNVAEILRVNAETVRQRLLRGRRMLRAELMVARALERTRPAATFTATTAAAIAAAVAGDARADPAPADGAGAGRSSRRHPGAVRAWRAMGAAAALVSTAAIVVVLGREGMRVGVHRTGGPGQASPGAPANRASTGAARGSVAPMPPAFAPQAAPYDDSTPGPNTRLAFDFENGLLPPEFEQGHVVPAPPGSKSRFCLLGTLRPSWMKSHEIRLERSDGEILFPYSPTGVVSFDYWAGTDSYWSDEESTGLMSITVWLVNAENRVKYSLAIPQYEMGKWQHAELPLTDFLTPGPSRRAFEAGDRIRTFAVSGGRAGGQPFYVDNIRYEPR